MEPNHKRTHDILDTVIADSLREHFGAPPSKAVWQKVLTEITTEVEPPVVNRYWAWLQQWWRAPMVRTAFVFMLFFLLVGKPAITEYQRASTRVLYPDVTMVLPTVPRERPLPQQDLQGTNSPAAARRSEQIAEARRFDIPVMQLQIADLP